MEGVAGEAAMAAAGGGGGLEFHSAGFGFTVPSCYTALAPVGRGAFGMVVKADVVPNAPLPSHPYFKGLAANKVAIKKISAGTAYKDSYHAKQVFREIYFLKQLLHDNVIKLVDLFSGPSNDIYIVTEAMDCDLANVIGSEFNLVKEHVVCISYQLLRGLKYLHSAGILHRDLKPQNILINSTMEARICDLGLARVSAPRDALSTGYVTTRWYRAPEVMLTWQHYTNSLDVWSAGCIIAEMICRVNGKVTFTDTKTGASYYALFPADSHVEHLRMILTVLGAPPRRIVEQISEESIKQFVQSKIDDLAAGTAPSMSIGERIGSKDNDLLALLHGLLHYDPAERISAEHALTSPFLAVYHSEAEEPSRDVMNMSSLDLDLPLDMWREYITQELNLSPPVLPDIPAIPLMDDILAPDLAEIGAGQWADAGQLQGIDAMAIPVSSQIERAQSTMFQIQQEMLQLEALMANDGLGPRQKAQLIASLAEVRSRFSLYQQQYEP